MVRRRAPPISPIRPSKGIRFRISLIWTQIALKRGSSSARKPLPDPTVMGDDPGVGSCRDGPATIAIAKGLGD